LEIGDWKLGVRGWILGIGGWELEIIGFLEGLLSGKNYEYFTGVWKTI